MISQVSAAVWQMTATPYGDSIFAGYMEFSMRQVGGHLAFVRVSVQQQGENGWGRRIVPRLS